MGVASPPHPLPPLYNMESKKKTLQSLMQEEEEERRGGGWAPFMPNITILIALMLFLVWMEDGGWRGRGGRKPSQHSPPGCTATFLTATLISYFLPANSWRATFLPCETLPLSHSSHVQLHIFKPVMTLCTPFEVSPPWKRFFFKKQKTWLHLNTPEMTSTCQSV